MVQTGIPSSAGERQSGCFPELARRYYEPVYQFLARQLSSREDAADLTQEVFLKAHQAFGRFDDRRPFAPWIFTIARRTLADFYRGRSPETGLAVETLEEPAPNPRDEATGKENTQEIWDIAGTLKPKLNQVLLLHYRENFSIKETAHIMGITGSHVKVLLFRARAALKDQLSRSGIKGGTPL